MKHTSLEQEPGFEKESSPSESIWRRQGWTKTHLAAALVFLGIGTSQVPEATRLIGEILKPPLKVVPEYTEATVDNDIKIMTAELDGEHPNFGRVLSLAAQWNQRLGELEEMLTSEQKAEHGPLFKARKRALQMLMERCSIERHPQKDRSEQIASSQDSA